MSNFANSRDNSSLLTIVKAQIVFLLSTLTEDRYERNQAEIRSLSEQHGLETYVHFLRRLIAASQSRLASNAPTTPFDTSSALTFRLLAEETQRLARDPFLADRFREAIDKGEGDIFRHFDLIRFCERVGLKPLEKLVLASSIISTSTTRRDLASQAAQLVRLNFDEAIVAICKTPSFDQDDLSPSQLAKLLSHLLSDPPPDSPILDAQQRVTIIASAQSKIGIEIMAPILQKIFPTLSLSPGTSLVQTLCQLGPELTADSETVLALLRRFGVSESSPPRESQVSEILQTLARYAGEGSPLCDVGALVKAICSLPGDVDWCSALLQAFDRPERSGVDTATLKLLIAILPNTPRDVSTPSVQAFWRDWSNTMYQLHLLDALLSLPNDTFNLVSLPGRRIVTVDDVGNASPTIKSLAANVQGHTWNSLELIETLCRIGDSENADVRQRVREMLDKAVKISAELVHMGLLQVPKPWGSTHEEYSKKLLGMFLAGHPNHQLVFMRIWQINREYLTSAFRDYYADSALNITRILDIAQDLKILDELLEVRPFGFALDVAALASRREYLNLDKWLSDHATAHGEVFIHAVIEFLENKVNSELSRLDSNTEHRTMAINPSTITIFIKLLRGLSMSPADAKYFLEVRNLSYTLHPKLLNLTPGSDAESGLTVATFPPNVEQEVESIYSRIYAGDISIEQALDMLRQSKAGASLHDKEIFACMLHSLFDEYKFFHQYPARELAMTGYMFGSIVQMGLLETVPLGIAIRYVLEAIRSPPDSNLFAFGIEALMRFESRLVEWAPLCSTLLRISHLHTARPDVAEVVRRALVRAENASGDGGDALAEAGIQLPELDPAPLTFTSIQSDDMSVDPITEPQPEESEKILFIINNLAPTNFQAKLDEMKERFREDYSRWFANYLVDQRVSTEPNNHSIYLRFLDGLESHRLQTHVLNETYFKSSILLNTEQKPGQAQSASEKTALKNLGSWLGSITLARNQAIKHRNLAFKELLMEGYDGNRLTKALPFICKVLEQSSKSLVFLPPNPWLMGVLGLLAELYQFADLRLNLKFEIEVLCKALRVELDKLEATTILRDRAAMIDNGPSFPDFAPGMDSLPIGPYETSGAVEGQHTAMLQLGSGSPAQTQPLTSHVEAIIADISNHTVINPQLASLTVNPGFKRSVQLAIERAVRDIIVPVVERSVTIASISSRELVAKDFATEPNEDRMRKAAHLMVQYLAGNLALVTCKEPLRSNMVTHIRHLLNEQGYTEQVVPEQAILLIVAENIDAACAAIEKAAMDRAVAEVDDAFSMAYADRRVHREQRNGQPFWDSSILTSDFIANLPEPLRLQTNGVLDQFRVYSDFDPAARSYAVTKVPGIQRPDRPGLTYGSHSGSNQIQGQIPGGSLGHHQAVERFAQIVNELERLVDQMPPSQTAAALSPSHEISLLIRQVLLVVTQAVDREETALAFSQKVVQLLYKAPSQLGREVYVALLDRLCNASPQVSREATEWLLYAEDERKFNVPVTALLLRSNLIPFPEQDAQLAKLILRDMKPSTINFTANLIRDSLLGNAPYASRDRFRLSLEALSRCVQERKSTEVAMRLLEDLQAAKEVGENTDAAMYDRLARHYADWVRLYQRSPALEKSFVSWVTQLTAQGILKGEEISSFFYRVCVEASVTIYSELVKNVDQSSALQPVDALARLIVLMIKYNGDAVATKVHYLTKILSIVVVVLAHLHEENGPNFPQKPFFRLFSSIFSDLNAVESTLHGAYPQLLNALCDTFNTLQPTYFPGFAFSWIALISHRLFMPKLLSQSDKAGWPAFHRLLVSLFKFLGPFIRGGNIQAPSRALFRGAQRFLLVLLHDFPEFLSEYYFTICDVIPPQCIQLRNVVLSAFPPSLTLPDPHVVDINSELGPIPTILSDFTSVLGDELRSALELHLMGRGAAPSVESIRAKFMLTPSTSATERYNTSLINATILFIGVTSVAQSKARNGSSLFSSSDPGPQFLTRLASDLDLEGQHHLMSAVVMHLRYPNAHTQWFSSLTLHLFVHVKGEMFQEIITKVLLERFVVHRPHPWGAILTFIELLRNPEYDFWSRSFVHAVPEITALLESVSRSISQSV